MPMMETSAAILALVAVGAYLLGSVPFGIVITRALGLGDLRKIGSGNIGATNVLRTGNKGAALATLVLDAGKGGIAVALARLVGGPDAALLARFAGRADARAKAEKAIQHVWTDLAANWWAPGDRMGGTNARTYDYLFGKGYTEAHTWTAGWLRVRPELDITTTQSPLPNIEALITCICPSL